ncbi:unnamed protein product [Protopolystoma xenopodis]|uniref:Septin-type G domain-containing protein n=1 Tax=Protopolystoma xenopodis TaxID=117903 RepID=A0A448X640_9PLAT|nr:unnamed protein product [Protopolystoma xenopodis]
METLFNESLDFEQSSHDLTDVKLRSISVGKKFFYPYYDLDLKEGNVNLKLIITETSGFGDQINREDSTKPVLEFIDEQYEKYLQEELKIKRNVSNLHDTRIHACLYFISPTGHSLKSLDLLSMKRLETKVNIIPVIAKSDTITRSELKLFKERVSDFYFYSQLMTEIHTNNIHVYQFPTDDEAVSEVNKHMNRCPGMQKSKAVI